MLKKDQKKKKDKSRLKTEEEEQSKTLKGKQNLRQEKKPETSGRKKHYSQRTYCLNTLNGTAAVVQQP